MTLRALVSQLLPGTRLVPACSGCADVAIDPACGPLVVVDGRVVTGGGDVIAVLG